MLEWKGLEKRIRDETRLLGMSCIKIPNHTERAKLKGKIITVERKTEFDFCAGIDGLAVFLDAKYVSTTPYKKLSGLIGKKTVHQYQALADAWARGNISGYLIHLTMIKKIIWAPISSIITLVENQNLPRNISMDTPGISSQDDSEPINLRRLTWNQRAEIIKHFDN